MTSTPRIPKHQAPDQERLLELLVENCPDNIVWHGLDLRVVWGNQSFFSACGRPPDQMLSALPQDLPFLIDPKSYSQHLRYAMSMATPFVLQIECIRPNGARYWSRNRLVPVQDSSGQAIGILAIAQDISDLKKAQRKLEKAEKLAQIGFWEWDYANDTARLSRQACELHGHPPEWSPNRTELLALHTPEERQEINNLYKTALASQQPKVQYDYTSEKAGKRHRFRVESEIVYSTGGAALTQLSMVQDITEHLQAQEILQSREQEFRALVENTPDIVARYDPEYQRVYANAAWLKMAALSPDALMDRQPAQELNTAETWVYESCLRRAFSTGEHQEYNYRFRTASNRDITCQMRIAPEFNRAGHVVSVLTIGRDVSAFEEAERRLKDSQRIARLYDWEWSRERKRAIISRSGLGLLGFPDSGCYSISDFQALIPIEERPAILAFIRKALMKRLTEVSYEHGLVSADGSRRDTHSWLRIEYGPNGRAVRILGVTQDVTDLKALQRETHQLAFYDPLTQLPNRALLQDRLKIIICEAIRKGTSLGLVLLDLDHFQKINDSLGSGTGDALLKAIAGRLSQALRDYDTVARLSSDEFAVIVPQISEPADRELALHRIKQVFRLPFSVDGIEIFVTASAGIALFPSDGAEVDELVAHADAAMHHAKQCGRNNFQFYERELTARATARLKIEGDLRKAIKRNELEMFYQPKVELSTGRVVGAEALMRWNHPEWGLVMPDRFIGVAEETGLIIEMGAWALKVACEAAKQWHDRTQQVLKIAVNLSARQFYSGDLIDTITRTLEQHQCSPEWIELEITESLLLNDRSDVHDMLARLHSMGFTIAIDDFGTGYSALSYLTRFPVDTLKIDRSFIHELTTDKNSEVLAKAIVTLAHSLRMVVVAEGVETKSQRDALASWGCQMAQGYLYSKPLPLKEFIKLVNHWPHGQLDIPKKNPNVKVGKYRRSS